jgi:hypothetical protein
MMGALGVLLGLVLMLGVGYCSLLNQTPVSIQWWPGMPPHAAFVWEIAVYSAGTGWLTAMLFLAIPCLGAQRRCRQLRRRLRELEARLAPGPPVVGETPLTALENGGVTTNTRLTPAVSARVDEEPV